MPRLLSIALGPELLMAVIVACVFGFCARHATTSPGQTEILERLIFLLPPLIVLAVFLTVFVPGAANWWWLGRASVVSMVGTGIVAGRIIAGFGSGAKGQDAAFIVAIMFAGFAASLAIPASGAYVLARTNSSFAEWFRMRPVIGVLLTIAAAVPVGVALFFIVSFGGGILLGIWSAFRR